MEGQIRGSFPGGPSRAAPPVPRTTPPRLRPVAEIEERSAQRSVDRRHRKRAMRMAAGFLVVLAVADAAGGAVGLGSHRSQEDLTDAQRVSRTKDFDISKEVNRTLLNLWKMEDVEAVRNRGRTR